MEVLECYESRQDCSSYFLEYGYRLFKKNEKVVSQHQYIRQQLRELGRLLEARKFTHVKTILELIKPEQYSVVVTAAKNLSGFSEHTRKYHTPSLARKVGHSLHALDMFVTSEGLLKMLRTLHIFIKKVGDLTLQAKH